MQIVNTKGAAAKLGCSENWIHKLVSRGKLKAHIFVEGVLVDHIPDGGRAKQGQGLYFLESDLKAYQPKSKGRPMGKKDAIGDNPKRKGRPRKQTEEIVA